MNIYRKPNGYWTFDRCAKEALKYRYRKEFDRGSKSAAIIARRNKWYDDICSHMIPMSSLMFRYVYEIADHVHKRVYIGLSYNPRVRAVQHRASRQMSEWFPDGIEITVLTGKLSETDAQDTESGYVNAYKAKGYVILNKAKTGGLGGSKMYWTFDRCREEALKYASKKDFREASKNAYAIALRKGWFPEICSHMIDLRRQNGYWTFERCREEALKYRYKVDFQTQCSGAFNASYKNGWYGEITKHMKRKTEGVGRRRDIS